MERQKLLKRIIIGLIIAVLVIFVVLPFGATLAIYNGAFGHMETAEPWRFAAEDFPELSYAEHSFVSDKGQQLAGRLYKSGDADPDAILVLAHGHGDGHIAYLPVIDYFAHHGFWVFAYDVTGCDHSEGKKVGGVPQYLSDLDAALDYLAGNNELKDYPRLLWGHSVGGYAVLNVLADHPEVKGTIALAGFNTSRDMMRVQTEQNSGEWVADQLLPYFKLHEKMHFGDLALRTAVKTLNPQEEDPEAIPPQGRVMIVQSKDDTQVPLEISYNIFLLNFHNDPRFVFKQLDGRGHEMLYYSPESIAYMNSQKAAFEAHFADSKPTREEADAWWAQNLDKDQAFVLDQALFDDFVDFYRDALKQAQ